MKFFTNKSIVQKIVIAIVIVILTTFCVPVTVQADVGGKLAGPITQFVAAIFDGVQHILEWVMLGETKAFMSTTARDQEEAIVAEHGSVSDYIDTIKSDDNIAYIETDEFINASIFDAVNVPEITYTPEAIFSNRVPALDINFINPSITKDEDGNESETIQERNVALQLQPIIASWYVAIRSIAVVGLLTVLVYLGIRMMLTSIAADRAKYKQMLMDWIVAMCLVFVLHYIMSFALTMVETITSMLSSLGDGTIYVIATKIDALGSGTYSIVFKSNLMGYVRFMVQAGDFYTKIGFLAMYIMLVIYSIRFTWTYLKRVVNMAFLTLIAPLVALTYPIDKVSDGKAQAFNMWIKEFTYNALLQPIHLLLYTVLLGSAIQLAVDNPIYAIVALGFIVAAEKLVKQMFGFNKASGGTVGSLAAAAGVTSMAGKALNAIGHKGPAGGGKGKIRTKEIGERQGKDADANKPFKAFESKNPDDIIGANNTPLPPPGGADTGAGTPPPGGNGADTGTPPGGDGTQTPLPPPPGGEGAGTETPSTGGDGTDTGTTPSGDDGTQTPLPPPPGGEGAGTETPSRGENPLGGSQEQPETWQTLRQKDWEAKQARKAARNKAINDRIDSVSNAIGTKEGRAELKRKAGVGAYKAIRGVKAAAPTLAYKAARGTLRTASRVALAGAMGGLGLAIGATTGDGEKAMSMALGAAGVGFTAGDNVFDATLGKTMRDKSVRDVYEAGKYGNKIDARNARADKEYFRSEKFDDFYDKYYKGQYTKKEVQKFVQDYRKAGITSESEIRRAKKLEENYMKQNTNLSEKDARAQVQNIVQSYKDMDIDKKAYSDEKVKAKEISRIAGMLGGANETNNKIAAQIFQGYEDWRNSAV